MRIRTRTVRPKEKMGAYARENLRRAAHYAADQAIMVAKSRTRAAVSGAGLGRLAGAVADTSSLRNRRWRGRGDKAWGVIYARGGDESRASQSLSIYATGGTIVPLNGKQWLAFPNEAVVGRFMGRNRLTPARYLARGPGRFGRLRFIRTGPRSAILVARNQLVNRRTGRTRGAGRRKRTERQEKEVIIFFLIRWTRRSQRFNQDTIMQGAAETIPRFAGEFQARGGAR